MEMRLVCLLTLAGGRRPGGGRKGRRTERVSGEMAVAVVVSLSSALPADSDT